MADTLFHKVWNAHTVRTLPSGQTQLFIGLHLIHEVTSPQAFDMIRQHGWKVAFPERTVATIDHIVPTSSQRRPFLDVMAEEMTVALERNCKEFGIKLYLPDTMEQGIVHVIGPQLGLTQPGMTIACGDSHTSTHGAFGAIAMGIGTSQVRDVLASQCLAVEPLKVRRIDVNGRLSAGVYAKDVILTIIRKLGVQGGVGLRVRVRRHDTRRDVDGRADDDLQHVDRGRRARRLRQSGRDDVRVSEGPEVRAVRRRVGQSRHLVAIDGVGQERDVRRPRRRSTPRRSNRPSRGASTRASRSASSERIPAQRRSRSARLHGLRREHADSRHEDRRRVHRLVHERPAISDIEEAARIVKGHKVAKHVKALMVPGSREVAQRSREARAAPGLHRRRLRVARRGLLDVPRDEPGQARRTPGVRVLVESQLQGTSGQPDRPHAADEPGNGRRGGDRRRSRRRARDAGGGARMSRILSVSGRGIPVRGNDIDTDRIMPARFLKVVSFEGLEKHVFEDDRRTNRGQHPFGDMRYQDASILVVNANFGCGSSREHAPQGLVRYGHSRRSSASRSRRSSSATPRSSACPASPPITRRSTSCRRSSRRHRT